MRRAILGVAVLVWLLFSASNGLLDPPLVASHPCSEAGLGDEDGDGLFDSTECFIGTDHENADTDGDGLLDGEEVIGYGTSPFDTDTDNDTLSDGAEVNTHLTNPLSTDSDSDLMTDPYEVVRSCLDATTDDSADDPDADGLTNIVEHGLPTEPCDADTDDDGLTDGDEVNTVLTDPLNADSDGDGLAIVEPKTSYSRRQVALTTVAVDALRRHRVAQAEERLRLGPVWQDRDLVFANEVGAPVEASNLVNRSFLPLLRRTGLPRIRFHDLRHTAATLMLGRTVHPKIVADMLGHSRIAVTLDLYSHTTPDMQEAAVAAMDAVLAP